MFSEVPVLDDFWAESSNQACVNASNTFSQVESGICPSGCLVCLHHADGIAESGTETGAESLEAVGFVWDMKKGKRSPQNSPIKQHATQI